MEDSIQAVGEIPRTISKDESFDATEVDLDYDSFDDENGTDRPAERWAPLGAAVSPSPSPYEPSHGHLDKMQELEEEQEQLNSSLLALTTHFAQVQFRLKQIVSAEPDTKETLLKELEEFAFKGIPDVRGSKIQDAQILEELSEREHEDKITEQREKQRELIQQLKSQLEDLETYAYETGDADSLPTSRVMEKQKVVLEELRHKLDLNLENFDSLSTEELRQVVAHAVGQIVNPAKVKEKLVDQLKTQIVDLERFIQFLQGEVSSPGPLGKDRCMCPLHDPSQGKEGPCTADNKFFPKKGSSQSKQQTCSSSSSSSSSSSQKAHANKHLHESTSSMAKKALAVLQIYIISQLGCGSREFKRNTLKKTAKGNHWGDLRAKLEMAVTRSIQLAEQQKQEVKEDTDSDEYSSDSEGASKLSSAELTQCIRKDLAMAIRDLIQHGLMEVGQSSSLVPFGCFPSRSAAASTRMLHAWDLLLKYYEMKHGREYNESPARKLSQSFHLDMVGGKPITAKQTLLGAIDTVINSHTPLRRSQDAHLKAFVCMALNERKLVTWLRLLFRTQTLVDTYYQDWSYVARTGFEDALRSLERLLVINFNLPVDLAVRNFSNIKDAF